MENGYHSFADNFRGCCVKSCTRLAYEHEQNDAEYAGAQQECDRLYDLIKEKLGEEHGLVNEFDAAKNQTLAFGNEFIYQQGFQDCVTLLRWIGLI